MRFIDRILAHQHDIPIPGLCPLLRQAVKIVADNVASFYFEGSSQESWSYEEDFPNVAPPFENFWIEAVAPKFINSEEHGVHSWEELREGIRSWGGLFMCQSIPKDLEERKESILSAGPEAIREHLEEQIVTLSRPFKDYQDGTSPLPAQDTPEWRQLQKTALLLAGLMKQLEELKQGDFSGIERSIASVDYRWMMEIAMFIDCGSMTNYAKQPLLISRVPVRENGSIIVDMFQNAMPHHTREHASAKMLMDLASEFRSLLDTLLLTTCFMHCKNVGVRTVAPDQKESRLWSNKGHQPLVRYEVLELDHLKATLRSEGHMNETGLHRALHICRGHFAHYTEEHPLFGKYHGDFWIPQHTRGTLEQGKIEKTYLVK